MHGNTDTSLEGATDVVAVPGDTLRNVGVDAAGDHEGSKVLGTVGLDSSKNDKADDAVDRNVS